jgi:hypothetical protein
VRALATRPVADAIGKLNPLRMQRQMLSDSFALAPMIREQAKQVRAKRTPIADDHPLRQQEKKISQKISDELNQFRDQRDAQTVAWARQVYGPKGLGAWFKPDEPDADVALRRALQDLQQFRETALTQIADGGFAEAVCRIVLAGMISIGAFERRSLRLARLLAQLPNTAQGGAAANTDWVRLLKEQARITAVAPVEALNALEQMLPDNASRERALAVSAAVMMIEPTLANPRSEIIEFLMGTLGADPQRVIALARNLTQSLERPGAAPAKRKPVVVKRKARS